MHTMRTLLKTSNMYPNNPCRIFRRTNSNQNSHSSMELDRFEDISFLNEPVKQYLPDSEEREELLKALDNVKSTCEEIPIVINGKSYSSNTVKYQHMPHRHAKKLAQFYVADEKCIKKAIRSSIKAQEEWDNTSLVYRIGIWEKAAELMATTYRSEILAATMLGQSKTVVQAEFDAGANLVDHIRLNAQFLKQEANFQPISTNPAEAMNHIRLRGLEGFVAAISPFNNVSIAANIAYTPALMGNGVVWKPANTSMLSCWRIFNIMREAGLPDGVVNFVPAPPQLFGNTVTYSTLLAGINFTGSMKVFIRLWKQCAKQLHYYKNFPRLVGECGGKNFHFAHSSADIDTLMSATIRSAFEYGGQKCSACSRLYVPEDLWENAFKDQFIEETKKLIVDDVSNFDAFYSALIDQRAFLKAVSYIEYAKRSPDCNIICGGYYTNLRGFFVEPTVILVSNPEDRLFKEEIFAPILAVYVVKTEDMSKIMDLIANTPRYALTGSIFAKDKDFIKLATKKFKLAIGNFYVNDKSSSFTVGHQPFGGSRMSGTNDKSGGPHYILRWVSPQTIKEAFQTTTDIYYPSMSVY